MTVCLKCSVDKPYNEFRFITKTGRYQKYCRPCERMIQTEYRRLQKINDPLYHAKRRAKQQFDREHNRKIRVGQMFHTLKNNAIRRGLNIQLTRDLLFLLFEIQNWKCSKTGIEFDLRTGRGKRPFGPTVDRIDNARGYEIGNIQIVCNIYNMAKNEFTETDVLVFAKALVAR